MLISPNVVLLTPFINRANAGCLRLVRSIFRPLHSPPPHVGREISAPNETTQYAIVAITRYVQYTVRIRK